MTTLGAPAGLPISGLGCQCGGACELRLSYPACRAGYLQRRPLSAPGSGAEAGAAASRVACRAEHFTWRAWSLDRS